MNITDIARSRVRTHHLEPADGKSAVAVVSDLVAMQAQDYRGGLWSVGVRTPELTADDVERALLDREIVRTWPMRGTLHLVAAADARWLPELLGPRASQAAAGRRRGLGLDDEAVNRTRAAWEAVLTGGACLGRPELFAAMDAAGVDSGEQRGPHLLRYFAEQGLLCFGPHEGKQPTYALLQEWVPAARVLERDAALAELALRYFTGHGPATLDDFAGWAFLTKGDARAGLAAVEHSLESAEIDGLRYWFAESSTEPTAVQLLPGFDEYVLGYKNRSAFATPEILAAVVPGGNGMFKSTVLDDGRITGLWSIKKLARRQEVRIDWFGEQSDTERLAPAVERYGRFCGVPTELVG
ncbi:winged helix DNA-binding domain-containing protein [Nocardia stercoris]|uniref:Winged helix DNA-binding domain-containing protein n=1 Tax=Nocardia stercoris TaxID=2483361 RepID=A0A3M2KYW0_9NOCA|nr:winged helix DNA-binding domain-containing protein [Nocardia stercoris]RMI30304.1 winged helix DNA-binding domain-containing protein [Nocardia stercoris]